MIVGNQRGRCPRRAGVVLALVGALGLVCVLTACDGRETQVSNQEAAMQTVQIPVEGMSCVACAARVKKALTSMGGVAEVEVSLAERRARVRFDSDRVSADHLVAAIEGLGYQAGAAVDAP